MEKKNCVSEKGKMKWFHVVLFLLWLALAAGYLYWSFGVFAPQLKELDVNVFLLTLWWALNLVVIFGSMFVLFMLMVAIVDVFKPYQDYTDEEAEAIAFMGRD